jgi:dihydropteroate synthase
MSLPFRLMGVVNVTPDSFSDGGRFLDVAAALAHSRELAAQGADILDIGGESTRPGAEPVSAERELRRVLPVIEGLVETGTQAQISIDTSKASVARAALAAGASLVNDVSAFRADPEMAGLLADGDAECCLMHMLGEPRTMQRNPHYRDGVVDEVKRFLEERLAFAVREGVPEARVLLDPGIGFGKTVAHNLALLARLDELVAIGPPIVVGTSRKSFLGRIGAELMGAAEIPRGVVAIGEAAEVSGGAAPWPLTHRLPGTLATNVMAFERGASVFRVHDVAPVRAALAVAAATLGAG